MKLSVKAFALASSFLWGGGILCVAIGHMIQPMYGQEFFDVIASVYPGLQNATVLVRTIAATFYGLVDGAIAGALFAWLYNLFAP